MAYDIAHDATLPMLSLSTAADVAATFLLFGLFLIQVVVAAVLFGLWRVLRIAERSMSPAVGTLAGQLDGLRAQLQVLTRSAVAPQVDALAVWAGVRAGARALIRPPHDG